jgi:hypothetical protein
MVGRVPWAAASGRIGGAVRRSGLLVTFVAILLSVNAFP